MRGSVPTPVVVKVTKRIKTWEKLVWMQFPQLPFGNCVCASRWHYTRSWAMWRQGTWRTTFTSQAHDVTSHKENDLSETPIANRFMILLNAWNTSQSGCSNINIFTWKLKWNIKFRFNGGNNARFAYRLRPPPTNNSSCGTTLPPFSTPLLNTLNIKLSVQSVLRYPLKIKKGKHVLQINYKSEI